MGEQPRPGGRPSGPLTITEITSRIKETLESGFPDVYVVGEISRCTRASSGHMYLTLKDENAVLRAVIWRGVASSLRFEPREGVEVVAHGSIDVYPPRGSYQLIVSWLEPRGVGPLQLAFRQLREKLEKEGLFRPETKKSLPSFPTRIGVVTSPTGAAVRDVVNVIGRRFPPAEIYLYPSRVQGAKAAAEIAAALERLNRERPELDLLIVGRGGGSLEDLWAFNEEEVARAIYRSEIPVVSAVGHEIDFTISDFVADVRAATPTEAGEIVVPDRAELLVGLRRQRRRMAAALRNAVGSARERVASLASRPVLRRPRALLREKAQRADDLLESLNTALHHRLDMLREQVGGARRRLAALSPRRVLERGYSITLSADGVLLRNVKEVRQDDTIKTRLHEGVVLSRVLKTEEAGGD